MEHETPAEVAASAARLSGEGVDTHVQEGTPCCYALQDKAWVDDPDQVPWEIYTVLADVDGTSGMTSSPEHRSVGSTEVGVRSTPHCC